jgi:hemin uptake protein HemP
VELELSGLVSLQVFDARGALVHNEVFTASGARTQRILDLSTLAKGSYTLLVEHDGQRVSQTVVVE